MKSKNNKILILSLTAACLVFTAGYFTGRNSVPTAVEVRTVIAPTQESESASDWMVNINEAGTEELQCLNGIGEKTAERIIAYRKENGSFLSIEDILNVKGIGAGIFEQIRDRITVE